MMSFIVIGLIVAFIIGGIKGVRNAQEELERQRIEANSLRCSNCGRIIPDGATYYNYGIGLNVCSSCNVAVSQH